MALKINRTITKVTRIVGWGLVIITLVCFAKVYFWEKTYYKEQTVMARAKSQSVITKIPNLAGLRTTALSDAEYKQFQVESKAPKYIKIERTKLDTIVCGKNLSSDGAIQLADSINEAAWYTGTSNPGDGGAIVISGVSSYNGFEGAFRGLDTLEKGDKIKLISGDNNEYDYEVVSISITSNKDANKVLPTAQQRQDGKETLSLISISSGENSFVLVRATKQ